MTRVAVCVIWEAIDRACVRLTRATTLSREESFDRTSSSTGPCAVWRCSMTPVLARRSPGAASKSPRITSCSLDEEFCSTKGRSASSSPTGLRYIGATIDMPACGERDALGVSRATRESDDEVRRARTWRPE